jgi:hypothetical protein
MCDAIKRRTAVFKLAVGHERPVSKREIRLKDGVRHPRGAEPQWQRPSRRDQEC